MKLLLALALLQSATEECPIFLRAESYPPAVARLTRPYIDCLTQPDIPYGEQLVERRTRCAPISAEQLGRVERLPLRARQVGSRRVQPEDSFLWIDHVTTNLAGCHQNIFIAGDGARNPYAQNR